MSDIEKVIKEIKQINKDRDWDQFHSLDNLAKSISIEAGELLECFQWGEVEDKQAIYEELADVMIYCLDMVERLGVNPCEIMMNKLEKNKKKYPIEKAKGNSKKYTEFK